MAVLLPSNLDNSQVSEEILQDLVEDLSTDWRMVGLRLGIPQGAITNIDVEHHRVVDKGMAMFATWKSRKVEDATVRVLRKALEKTGRLDLSERVRDSLIQEKQPLPSLKDLEPVLPNIPPTAPLNTGPVQSQQQDGMPLQDQAEIDSHRPLNQIPASSTIHSTSPARVPRPPGTIDPPSRHSIPEHEEDVEVTDNALTDDQVDSDLKQQLQFDGFYLDPNKYDPVRELGSGGFAQVYLVIHKETGRKMACKMFNLRTNDRRAQEVVRSMEDEIRILSTLQHKHIVKFLDTEKRRKTSLLFLEYMEGGSLMDLLKKGPLEEPLVKKFTWQLLTAVNYLHTNNIKRIIHKDIKGANILLDRLRNNIKLADFGICTIMESLRTVTGGLVTNRYLASLHWTSPELLDEKEFGPNTDIWSVGCTVIEMLTTKPPVSGEGLTFDQKRLRIIMYQIDLPVNCTPAARKFIERCLRSDRPSAQALLQDPFVSGEQQ